MYLKSLVLTGFKSFSKKTELEFLTPITSIVGPNGSGKSNVAEAFRFVLGEQSIKSMRGKRGEDLIFNGSPAASRANRASVKIVLDNATKVFPIDFEEITIERIVHRDGVNDYLINGSQTRLRDVQELLASANIGPSGHHIISQGEADRILSASPRERREMIEEALGLKLYQYKKSESEKKLLKTRENIAHVESLRREVAPHLRFLERQVKKMERALELREELSHKYAEYLFREDLYLAFHKDRLTALRNEPIAELSRLESELGRARDVMAAESKDEKREALASLEEKMRLEREERQEAQREIGRIEGQVAYLERAIEKRKKSATEDLNATVPIAKVKRAVEMVLSEADRARNQSDTASLRAIIDDVARIMRSFLNDVSRQPADGNAESDDEADLTELHRLRMNHESEFAKIDKREQDLRVEYEKLKASIEADQSESRKAEREVFRIMGEQREFEQKISDIDRELKLLERDREDFKRELEEAVALVGRAAADYYNYVATETERGEMVSESREVQNSRRRALEKMKIRLEELGAGGGTEIQKEYEDAKARDEFLAREIADLEKSALSLEELIDELSKKLNDQFETGIEKISEEFDRLFGMMFKSGKASLVRVKQKQRRLAEDLPLEPEEDHEEEGAEGIDVDVKLPHKRIRGLEMLSGGERALTSIALIFAMSQVNPPLFVILDETDAALDEANSKRYGDMIESLARRSQLILITHNRETMSRAGILYGVTMGGDGISKLLSVKFDEAVAVAK